MKTAQSVSSSLGSSSMIKNVLNLKGVKYRWFYCRKVLPCSSLQNTWRKILLSDCSADETLQATAGEMRGDSSGCAFSTPLLSSPLAHFFLSINSAWIYHQEALVYSNRMVLRFSCITSPILFHRFIPPSHTLFMLLLNLADCQLPGLLFHQVAFFSLSAGRISHSLSIIFFLTCPFTLFLSSSLSKPPRSSLVPYLYFCFSLPHFLSLFCAQEV